ncbi:MAG TPA: hypothetical protein VKY59_12525 [Spirillospora sp.]|nr:hypothetical protein [Spirillospora sp.]
MSAAMAFTAKIRGLPHNPAIIEVNARSGPATSYDSPFKAKVGLAGLPVLAVQPDENGTQFNGKVYQWFQLEFPDGKRAWVRDDLLAVQGDGVRFGYDNLTEETFAFVLNRRAVIAPGEEVIAPITPPPAPPPTPSPAPAPAPAPAPVTPPPAAPDVPAPPPSPLVDAERVRRAAYNITEAFEGSGYASFQNIDAGIISYGRFQFTLAGSGLFTVLHKYTSRASTPVAAQLRAEYLERIRRHDPDLRHDARLCQLCIEAASDPIMQVAQDETATELYWNVVQELSIIPRGIKTPLGQALIFDMGINFGPRHGFIGAAERELGVPPKSRLGENGAREEDLIAVLARLRKQSHDRQAERDNLPGLRVRGDFWVKLVEKGDWLLEGDPDGTIEVKPGRRVRVRDF